MWMYFSSEILSETYVSTVFEKIIEWNLTTWGLRESGSQEPLEFFLVPHDIIELSRALFIYKTRWKKNHCKILK